jgi:hypothetical protein
MWPIASFRFAAELGRYGSKPEVLTSFDPRPLYLRKRTSVDPAVMSATGQQQTHAVQQTVSLFDHLVGSGEQ